MADADLVTPADAAVTAEKSPSLKDFVCEALTRQVRGKRNFDVNIIKSKPKRAYALFPWASDTSVKVWQEHVLLIIGEQGPATADNNVEKAAATDQEAGQGSATRSRTISVPVVGIEFAIYTVPATSTCLVYVSKVDTTGLLLRPAPTKIATIAVLEYYLSHPPHDSKSVRVHVFARAQDQYLFPGSIENKQKRRLNDAALCKWWRSVLSDAAEGSIDEKRLHHRLQLFYLLPGLDQAESHAVLPVASPLDKAKAPHWQYGHPYSNLKPPLPLPLNGAVSTLGDLIPAFQDDPKSRFLTSLTSSPVSAAGEEGDYDEVHEGLSKAEETAPALHKVHMTNLRTQKLQERARLTQYNVDEYWLLMGNRQECCDGHAAAFFVVAADRVEAETNAGAQASDVESVHLPHEDDASLPYASYVKLWSTIHNINYADNPKIPDAYAHWREDVRAAARRSGISEAHIDSEMCGYVQVDNPDAVVIVEKRKEAPVVNSLQPKKKKKAVQS